MVPIKFFNWKQLTPFFPPTVESAIAKKVVGMKITLLMPLI